MPTTKRKQEEDVGEEAGSPKAAAGKKKKAAAEVVVLQTERDVLVRKPALANNGLKVLSWNVNGLNAILSKKPDLLVQLVASEGGDVDVLLLQETKLQECKCAAFEDALPGYQAFWSCSKTKKGYAGVAAFVKTQHVAVGAEPNKATATQKTLTSYFGGASKPPTTTTEKKGTAAAQPSANSLQLLNVTMGMHGNGQDEEGRVVTLEFSRFFVVGVYVSNSGMKLGELCVCVCVCLTTTQPFHPPFLTLLILLIRFPTFEERLDYRLSTFNPRFQAYLEELNQTKPVVVAGDFNVAHLDLDVYNVGAKHLPKIPGLTPQERDAHTAWLATGWVDTFRHLHPTAKGAYNYWNVKTNARVDNKGLRLDSSFLHSCDVAGERGVRLHDSFILHAETVGFSDHAPIGIVLELLGQEGKQEEEEAA